MALSSHTIANIVGKTAQISFTLKSSFLFWEKRVWSSQVKQSEPGWPRAWHRRLAYFIKLKGRAQLIKSLSFLNSFFFIFIFYMLTYKRQNKIFYIRIFIYTHTHTLKFGVQFKQASNQTSQRARHELSQPWRCRLVYRQGSWIALGNQVRLA